MSLLTRWQIGDTLLLNSELFEVIGKVGGTKSYSSEDEAIMIKSLRRDQVWMIKDDSLCIKQSNNQMRLNDEI